MGITEIAKMLGVTRQRVHQLAKSYGFPEPVARLAQGPIWHATDVEEWAERTGRSSPQ
jgi:predicted DNA-binding transcriptional regulator AlpA